MRLQQLAVPLLSFFWACNSPATDQPFKGKEFEGLITYRVSYDNTPREGVYGDSLWIWYSKGNLLKVYNSKTANGLRKELFLLKGNKYYFQVGDSDSLYSADIGSEKTTTLEDSHHSATETRILGYNCEKIEQSMRVNIKSPASFGSTFLYSTSVLRMDKQRFQLRKFASFDRYMDEAGSFYLKFTGTEKYRDREGLSSYSFTAVKIQEQPVDTAIFQVDTSKVRPFKMN